MTFKTPSFWYSQNQDNKQRATTLVLTPISWLYTLAGKVNQAMKTPRRVETSVICIGNLNAGGSGKTPCAIALMDLIKEKKLAKAPAFLTRGYGGSLKGPLKVDGTLHRNRHVGDEALLLANHGTTIMSSNRFTGAQMAETEKADLIVMDDGLQNYDLIHDLKIAVIDGQMGFGNKRTIPAGPLRDPLKTGLQKPDLFILIGEDTANILPQLPTEKPVVKATISADTSALKDESYIAFCGLGYPKKFFDTLRAENITLHDTIAYADHHPYTHSDIESLITKANKAKASLITTEKDLIRIPTKFHHQIHILPITMTFQNPKILQEAIKDLKS